MYKGKDVAKNWTAYDCYDPREFYFFFARQHRLTWLVENAPIDAAIFEKADGGSRQAVIDLHHDKDEIRIVADESVGFLPTRVIYFREPQRWVSVMSKFDYQRSAGANSPWFLKRCQTVLPGAKEIADYESPKLWIGSQKLDVKVVKLDVAPEIDDKLFDFVDPKPGMLVNDLDAGTSSIGPRE